MQKNYLKKINIFTMLLIAASFAFAFRIVDLATFETKSVKEAQAVEASSEEPPAMAQASTTEPSQEDVEKAVSDTLQNLSNGNPPTMPPAPPSAVVPPPDMRAFSAAEVEVLQSLSKRREELELRERKLAEGEALLRAAEQEVDKKIAELNALKGELENLLGKQQDMEESRIVSLVKIYEAMKPKEAATIFNTLEMDVLLAVVGRMNERKLSPILASMDPEKARTVTIQLAEQRQLPGAKMMPASDTAEEAQALP